MIPIDGEEITLPVKGIFIPKDFFVTPDPRTPYNLNLLPLMMLFLAQLDRLFEDSLSIAFSEPKVD